MRLISKRQVDMQVKSKSRILFIAIICLFGFQFFPEPSAAMDDMFSQGKIEAQTVQTLKTQPAEPKADEVMAIPGLPLKLRPGGGCADHTDYSHSIRVVATHPFKIKEICFGDTKGPDIKHDFKWFMISGNPTNWNFAPGLVLSLKAVNGCLVWKEITGGMADWRLIEKLPKFTMFGLKYHRTPKCSGVIMMGSGENKSFKWRERVYDCADLEKTAPPGFKRVFLYDYCWFEKTTGQDILPESL